MLYCDGDDIRAAPIALSFCTSRRDRSAAFRTPPTAAAAQVITASKAERRPLAAKRTCDERPHRRPQATKLPRVRNCRREQGERHKNDPQGPRTPPQIRDDQPRHDEPKHQSPQKHHRIGPERHRAQHRAALLIGEMIKLRELTDPEDHGPRMIRFRNYQVEPSMKRITGVMSMTSFIVQGANHFSSAEAPRPRL